MNQKHLAQITNNAISTNFGQAGPGQEGATLAALITTIWRTLITLGGLAVLVFFIWGGLSWLTAGGDKANIESARNKITNALIGMTILFASIAIVNFLGPAIGFDLLRLEFPDNLTQNNSSGASAPASSGFNGSFTPQQTNTSPGSAEGLFQTQESPQ